MRQQLNLYTMKALIYRVATHNGRKEYRRTKCCNLWSANKDLCWKFSLQGARKIIETYNEHNRSNFYTYGIETIES